MRQGRRIGGAGGRRGRLRAPFVLPGLLALLLMTLAGCDLPQPFHGDATQNCVSQTVSAHGPLGAGDVVVPLRALDPTSEDKTSALYGLRASDGAVVWSCASTTYAGWDDAQLVNGVIYALAGSQWVKDGPPQTHAHALYAIRPQDGRQLWSYSFAAGSTSTLAFDHGLLFVSAVTFEGASSHSNLYAIHTASGALAWNASFGETIGQPIIVGHHLIVSADTAHGQELRGVSEGDGSTLWTYALSSAAAPGLWLSLNGVFYFSDGNTLNALDGATGALRWSQQASDEVTSELFSAQGAILFSSRMSVLAFDMATGALRWSAVVGDQPRLMAASDQTAYVVTQGAYGIADHLYALDVGAGDVRWQYDAPFAAAITPTTPGDTYFTISTGPRKLADVVAFDSRGHLRWTYRGTSPSADGALIPSGAALYYVWQADQAGISVNAPTITYVTRLRASDGAEMWTTPLDAYNALLLPPLLIE